MGSITSLSAKALISQGFLFNYFTYIYSVIAENLFTSIILSDNGWIEDSL